MNPLPADIAVPDDAIELKFVRSSGPGGQNVNKVATAVQLRVDLTRAGLSDPVRARLEKIAGDRVTTTGELVLFAQSHRSQLRNRQDAFERLETLLRRAASPQKPRIPTRPTRAARRKRIDTKKQRGRKKRLRTAPRSQD